MQDGLDMSRLCDIVLGTKQGGGRGMGRKEREGEKGGREDKSKC